MPRGSSIALAAVLAGLASCATAYGASDSPAGPGPDDASPEGASADAPSGDADAAGPDAVDGANDGGAADGGDAGVPCSGVPACARHVFMTSRAYVPAQIANPTVAYGLCSDLVNGGNGPLVGRKFEAWLSVTGNEAKNRLVHGTKPYVSSDGAEVIASSWTALTSGTHAHGITQDENGAPLQPGSLAWTGTDVSGAVIGNCNDWTTDISGGVGAAGRAGATDASWTNTSPALVCSGALHLLCIEQ